MGIPISKWANFWKRWAAWFVGPTDPRDQIIETLDDTLKRDSDGYLTSHALVIEIDNFADVRQFRSGKEVRRILRILSERLKGGTHLPDIVRTLDGDQFAVAISPLRSMNHEQLLELAARTQGDIAKPIPLEHGEIHVTVSIGCASAQELDDPRGENLLEAARLAQVAAAEEGSSKILAYTPSMTDKAATRRSMLADAMQAIKNGEIQAFFQPQICLKTHRISGFEALARWQHNVRGLISPAEFLPILEDAGMMRHLGFAMLCDALRALRGWDDAGYAVPSVSVNMSADELRDPNLVDSIAFELDRHALDPSRLVVEVLETVVANGPNDPLIFNLHALSKMGCSIDLDDFGTGQASITTIKDFAIKRIKIDRSFVSDIDHDDTKQTMVDTILTIAKSLAIETLAEGVESTREMEHLSRRGCGHAQGFVIAKPLPFSETIAWIGARAGLDQQAS